jgi:hypothetical protein
VAGAVAGAGGDRVRDVSAVDPRYVAARRALLDALIGLESHADALVIAGAQAVYLHTGDGDLAVAPFTTDADLAVNPERLASAPLIEAAMKEAGFQPALLGGHVEPGIWMTEVEVAGGRLLVPVDLIVPEAAASGGGRRAARLGAHGRRAARRATGLEAALVDNAPRTIAALDPADSRSLIANVAGPAALLVAKAHKIHERVESGRLDRLDDKDAADVVRLMQTTVPETVGTTLAQLEADPVAGGVSAAALDYLEALFGRRGRPGIDMATRAMRLALPAARVEAICSAYTTALLRVAR